MAGNTEKILIAEVSDNTIHYDFFPFFANVWLVRTDNDYTGFADPVFELENIGLDNDLTVISIQVKKIQYFKTSTIAEVIDTQSSFFFEDRTLLIHFENHKPFYFFGTEDIEIGFILGFYNTNAKAIGVFNNVQYAPRLKSSVTLIDSKDDEFFGRQKLQSGTIEIDNQNLKLKNFNIGAGVKNRTGNFVRTLIWTGPDAEAAIASEFIVTYQGVIEKITEGQTIKISLRDLRSTLSLKSPSRFLDTTNFPDIKDPDKNYILPQAWGVLFDVSCLCLNANTNKDITNYPPTSPHTPNDFQFLVCDTINHSLAADSINTIYINGTQTDLTATIQFDTSQNFAFFIINEEEFRAVEDTNDNGTIDKVKWELMDKVTIDMEGYLKGTEFRESDGNLTSDPTGLIQNAMAIIREIIRNNEGFEYKSVFYDIPIWQSFEDNTNVTYKIGFFVNKPITTQKQIEQISASILGKFIWNENRKFTFDNDDFVDFELEITKDKFMDLDYFPTFITNSTKVLATFRVGIKRKWDEKEDELEYQWLIDESNEENALTNFNSTLSRDFNTLINNTIDGNIYSGRLLKFSGISDDRFTITVPWQDHFQLKSGQFIRVQGDSAKDIYISWARCQIQKVSPNIDTWQIILELRIFGFLKFLINNSGDFILDSEQRKILVEA